jgi:hypothetical protein
MGSIIGFLVLFLATLTLGGHGGIPHKYSGLS